MATTTKTAEAMDVSEASESKDAATRSLRRLFWTNTIALVSIAVLGRAAVHWVHRDHTTVVELMISAASLLLLMPAVALLFYRHLHGLVMSSVRAEEHAYADAETTKAQLARVVDAILDPIASIDERGLVLSANPAVERVFGWKQEELQGRNVNVHMGSPYREEHDGYIDNYLRTGQRKAIGHIRRVLGRRRDGTEFPCELSVAEIKGAGGERHFVGVVRDISEREQLAARLAHTERLAALGELAATVAHEVNNPVNTIINCAQLIKDGDDDPQVLDHITQEGLRIASIVRDLLDFARDRRDEDSTTHVADVVRRTLSLIQGRIEKNGIKLRVQLPPELPPLQARPQQIQQVLLNLLINARDALMSDRDKDGKEIQIGAAVIHEDGTRRLRIRVRDNGPGIPIHDLERVFQPFFTTKADRGGNGLGLAVSRSIAQEHGGRLWAETVPGEHCEFILELPVDEEGGASGASRADR